MEINAPRYVRLIRNLRHEGDPNWTASRVLGVGTWKSTKLGVKVAGFAALVSLWNATFFDDEEEELSDHELRQMHLILGRRDDGTIMTIRIQGAFSDALSWFDLQDLPQDAEDLVSGKKGWAEQFKEMAIAPFQKLWHASIPLTKMGVETAAGKTTWPDFLSPRPVRDRWEHVARTFSLGSVYGSIMGKPQRGWGSRVASLLVNSTDPGEAAYFKTLGMVRDFRDKQGESSMGGFTPTERGNALYYHKQALRFGDFEAAEKYLREYARLGGTRKGLKASIRLAEPTARVPKKLRRQFLFSLSPSERQTLKAAQRWYQSVYQRRGLRKAG